MHELDKLILLVERADRMDAFMVLLEAIAPRPATEQGIVTRGSLEISYNGGESWAATIRSADPKMDARTAYGRSRFGAVLSLAESISQRYTDTNRRYL